MTKHNITADLYFFSLLTGLTSGFPYLLTSDTLKVWMSLSDISLIYIGLASLINLPYTLRFIWAPILDSLGEYRIHYAIVSIFLCAILLFALSMCQLEQQPFLSCTIALFVAFFGASTSVALESHWLLTISDDHRKALVAANHVGFRLALIMTGGLSLVIADHTTWSFTYRVMSCLLTLQGFYFLHYRFKSNLTSSVNIKQSYNNLFFIMKQLLRNKWLLVFIITYKISDGFVLNMLAVFMLQVLQISATELGIILKVVGLSMSLIGAFYATWYIRQYPLSQALKFFSIFQSLTILLLALIAQHPPSNLIYISFVIAIETFSNGCLSVAIMTFILELINKDHAASEYAFYTTLSSSSRYFIGPITGFLISYTSWTQYFICASLLGLCSVVLLGKARHNRLDIIERINT